MNTLIMEKQFFGIFCVTKPVLVESDSIERDGTGIKPEPEPRLKTEPANLSEWATDHGETDLMAEYAAEARQW